MKILQEFSDTEKREMLDYIKTISTSEFLYTWNTSKPLDHYSDPDRCFDQIKQKVIISNQDFKAFMNAVSNMVDLFKKKKS